MTEFRMPSLGADMEAGTLVEWLVKPGDRVARGDIVAVVETQKGAIEIEIFDEGQVNELLVTEGTTVPVGTPLAMVGVPGEAAPVAPAPAEVTPPEPVVAAVAPPPAARPTNGVKASPAARKLAAERDIDLAGLTGSGPGGAVVRADVEALAGKPAAKAPRGLDLAEMRKAIAAAMARSKREIPHYYVETSIDMTAATRWLEAANAARPPPERLLISVLLLKATALALRKFPELNGFFAEGAFRPSPAIHCGMAVAMRGGGLIAPAIHDTDQKSLDQLMAGLRDLVARVRKGGMRGSELADPTMTVTSLGERGVETVFGVIYPPQVAIVGFGRSALRPWVVEGAVEPRPIVKATLAADHRVSDGHRGALMLAQLADLLQEPDKL